MNLRSIGWIGVPWSQPEKAHPCGRTNSRQAGHPLAATEVLATDADWWGSLWGGLVITASARLKPAATNRGRDLPRGRKLARPFPFGSANRCDCVEHLLEMRDAQRRVQQFSDAIKAVGLVFSGVR
jgi:hypothetical protein